MKVLEVGNPDPEPQQEFICTGSGNGGLGCKSKLLVFHSDVYITISSALGEEDYYQTFMCIRCGVETDIPSSKEFRRVTIGKSTWLKKRNL